MNMVNVKNIVLGIAIFILTIFVGIYGINTFYGKAPQYNDYCPVSVQANTELQCIMQNGTWINGSVDASSGPKAAPVGGYCDFYTKCNDALRAAEEKYYKGAFLIALPVGIIIIALGLIIFALAPVGVGLMAGGIGIMIYGAGNYWTYANDVLKFIMSLIGLVIVILLAYYFNKKFNFGWFKEKKKSSEKEK